MSERAYADRDHPGNKVRPRVVCVGCRKPGCTTAWGPWCYDCNVERMDRIGGFLTAEIARHEGLRALAASPQPIEGEGKQEVMGVYRCSPTDTEASASPAARREDR